MKTTIIQLREEIGNKEISINQLSEYINNRVDTTPNYSMLLGAGCSVSSGVRPANSLISHWKKQIFLSENSNYNTSEIDKNELTKQIDDYFRNSKVTSWYDYRNEYGSLFEHKYTLQRQRRVFVEKEVRDKNPSIGYAYLIQLVTNSYLTTLFTTNFDDLINEAFYQFSDIRPIVCAHDSAISSITVTSQRPKIIKLHGDYLFDDIKTTARETESLEENIKNKFIEFAKDFGLIVVGYSGADRSIMDVITYLLKQEPYFSHGIYWCLRQDSVINSELRKLFWKEKVFFVEIEGFDELMAELNSKLNSGILPIDTYQNTKKAINIVNSLTNNEIVSSSPCPIIKKDLELIKSQSRVDALEVALDTITNDNYLGSTETSSAIRWSGKNKLTYEARHTINRISIYRRASQYSEALSEIEKELAKQETTDLYKEELYWHQALINIDSGDHTAAVTSFVKQFEINKNSVTPLLNAAHFSRNHKSKVNYIEQAQSIDKYDHRIYVEKAIALTEQHNELHVSHNNTTSEELISILNTGLEINPSIDNLCYKLLFDHYLSAASNKDSDKLAHCENLVKRMEKQNPFSFDVASLKYKMLMYKHKNDCGVGYTDTDNVLSYILLTTENANRKEKKNIKLLELKLHISTSNEAKINKFLNDYERDFSMSPRYFDLKAKALLKVCKDLPGAISALESAINNYEYTMLREDLALFYLYASEFEKAREVIFKYEKHNYKLIEKYYSAVGQYDKALEYCQLQYDENNNLLNYIVSKSFYSLKLKQFQEAFDILKNHLNEHNSSYKIHILVNYELARFFLNKNTRTNKISEHRNRTLISLEQAALAKLLGNTEESLQMIIQLVNYDYENLLRIQDWIVFEDFHNQPPFSN